MVYVSLCKVGKNIGKPCQIKVTENDGKRPHLQCTEDVSNRPGGKMKQKVDIPILIALSIASFICLKYIFSYALQIVLAMLFTYNHQKTLQKVAGIRTNLLDITR